MTKIIFELGETIFHQPVKLSCETDYLGHELWTIERGQGSPQDDNQSVNNLSRDLILRMIDCLNSSFISKR
jgi:hypothetical protein